MVSAPPFAAFPEQPKRAGVVVAPGCSGAGGGSVVCQPDRSPRHRRPTVSHGNSSGWTPRPGSSTGRAARLSQWTPSPGKTTVAEALQEELAEPFFHLSLDELRGDYLRRYWRQDHGGVLSAVCSMATCTCSAISQCSVMT
ncbi:phosphotransferase-like protein [Sphaerisporangium dianthi]|uniref:Uncharacterized protein n=1 Tax=Sphaerisporangium dianthi TaxID=1436120 RepID=A0ABV9CV32_9ACTN